MKKLAIVVAVTALIGTPVFAADVAVKAPPPALTATGGQVTTHTHFTDGILRAGLNYKFY